jgi:hypothetical protein
MLPLVFMGLAIVGAIVHLFVSKQPRTRERVVQVFLLYFLVVDIGVFGVIGASGHIFRADEIAEEIGWPTGSPFQYEVGVANLGFGVTGILCIWYRRGFWAATAIAAGIFLFADGIGHIREERAGDYAEYNAGPVLYTDFITPIVVWALLIAYHRMTGRIFERGD